MPRIRFTISGLMGLIVVAAIGIAGIREGTEIWASLTYTVTVLSLLMALPFLFYSQGKTRAGWLGFVLFSWVYLYFAFGNWWADGPGLPPLPTKWLLSFVHDRIHAKAQYIPNPNFPGGQITFGISGIAGPLIIKPGTTYWMGDERHYRQVAHCLLALALGAFGAFWFRFVYSLQFSRPTLPDRSPP